MERSEFNLRAGKAFFPCALSLYPSTFVLVPCPMRLAKPMNYLDATNQPLFNSKFTGTQTDRFPA